MENPAPLPKLISDSEQERFAIIKTRGAELQKKELHLINELYKLEWIGAERTDTASFYRPQQPKISEALHEARTCILTRFRHSNDESKPLSFSARLPLLQ